MQPRSVYYLIAAAVFILDRITKLVIERTMSAFDVRPVIPGFFDIVHTRNAGAAFSLLSDSGVTTRGFFLVFLSAAAICLLAALIWRSSQLDRVTGVALGLIMGGACGNVFDRIVFGTVTDFLDFYAGNLHWPTFNLADSCIVVGAALLLIDLKRTRRQPART